MSGELSSHMKHSVNQQILNKLNALLKGNSLKGNGSITLRQLTSRFSVLRGWYKTYDDITRLSGWGYDPKSGISTSTQEVIDTYVAAHPLASKFAKKKMEGYDILHSLWQDTHATGSFASGSQTSDKKHNVKDKRENSEIYSDDDSQNNQDNIKNVNEDGLSKNYSTSSKSLQSNKLYHRDQDNIKNVNGRNWANISSAIMMEADQRTSEYGAYSREKIISHWH